MIDLNIWFVTISHRPSLIRYHCKELRLSLPASIDKGSDSSLNNDSDTTLDLTIYPDSSVVRMNGNHSNEQPAMELDDDEDNDHGDGNNNNNDNDNNDHPNTAGYIEVKKSAKWLKEIRDVWRLIHLPFGANDKTLRVQVRDRTS